MIVGIDLGTTNSLIGVYQNETVKLFPNSFGQVLTPSVVSVLDDGSIAVGSIAKERLITHPQLTASLFKRLMGTSKKTKLGNHYLLPEELSALVLRSLIKDAEHATGEKVTEAVISVPAYFSDAQRKATKIAGKLAGIEVERLINEPTAAALAYGLQEKADKDNFLIIDIGGGTFDISILEIFDNVVEVHATSGDNLLGGEDFTQAITELFLGCHCLQKESLSLQEQSLINSLLEKTKIELSLHNQADLNISLKGKDYSWHITRDEFAQASQPLIQRMRTPIERAMRDAKLSVSDIDDIVLVGGASRMQLMTNLIIKMFRRFPLRRIDPDQAIAIGAVIASALKVRNSSLDEVILTDVCPYTLGIDTGYIDPQTKQILTGFYLPVIDRNCAVPVSRIKTIGPLTPEQKIIEIVVYQGENARVEKNVKLGEFAVDLPFCAQANRNVDIRFTYDINGILQVEATVQETGKKKEIFLKNQNNTMSQEEINESFEALSNLKIHPRDQQENLLLVAQAERIYQEYIDIRGYIQSELMSFLKVLEKQDLQEIQQARLRLADVLKNIEN